MELLTKAIAFASRPRRLARVDIPHWNSYVFVRSLTAKERDDFDVANSEAQAKGQLSNITARYAVLCACGPDGKPVFDPDDARQLGDQDGLAVEIIAAAAKTHNSAGQAGADAAEKN